jgi:serine/threonine-protein kinase
LIGTLLDEKYRIESLLGRGGMGAVYAAEDVRSGERVAVKIIQTLLPVHAADLVSRFEREARAAGSMDTEHIARCLGAGTDPVTGQPYMALEYLVGEDLQRVLKRTGPLDPEVALRITAQACVGLAHAHEANVIHRDIKPANLYLAKDKANEGRRVVKILDFGVAKILKDPGEESADGDGLTRTGSMLGSPMYMSPEQARSVKKVDQRADLWSLGVVLYKALAGRTPFDHISALGDMILALWTEPPAPVQQFAPWVAPEIAAIVDRLLQMEPADRFQSAKELLAAIEPMLRGGMTLNESMLVPMPEEARSHGAPTFFRRFDTKPRPDRPKTDPTPARAVTANPASSPDFMGATPSGSSESAPLGTSSDVRQASSSDIRQASASDVRQASTSDVRQASTSDVRPSGAHASPEGAPRSTSSPPGAVTQNGLVTTGAAPARGGVGVKALVLAGLGLAVGIGAVLVITHRGSSTPAPASSSASAASADVVHPPAPSVAPAPEPTAAASAATTASPTATVTAGPSAGPTSATPALHGALPPAKPKATAAPSAAPAPSGTAPKFTDFGDRK